MLRCCSEKTVSVLVPHSYADFLIFVLDAVLFHLMAAARYALNGKGVIIILLILLTTYLMYTDLAGCNVVRLPRPAISPSVSRTVAAAKFAIMSMSTKDTSYDYYTISNKWSMQLVPESWVFHLVG